MTAACGIVAAGNVRDFFRESVHQAVANQGVKADDHTVHYVVNLLTLFSRSEEFFEDYGESYGLRPLALMMADAAEARSAAERNYALQRIGDVDHGDVLDLAAQVAHPRVDLAEALLAVDVLGILGTVPLGSGVHRGLDLSTGVADPALELSPGRESGLERGHLPRAGRGRHRAERRGRG